MSASKVIAIDTEGSPIEIVQVGTDRDVIVTKLNAFIRAMPHVNGKKTFVFWDKRNDNPEALGISSRKHKISDLQAVAPAAIGPCPFGQRWGLCNAYNVTFDTTLEKNKRVRVFGWEKWPLPSNKIKYASMDVYATYRLLHEWVGRLDTKASASHARSRTPRPAA